ncbi:hypothetical protein [Paenibacillus sp. BK720]|uniref:hypothetical protein n=1 Tax=Paenibacillus sp. BK720 TaxID=2587092 RepID=UPI001423225B|nr:hypothetical protein [Paenibacillus sp. BK720]NIK67337.1 hypothetical protein [Paenibacillus sp. BK720]
MGMGNQPMQDNSKEAITAGIAILAAEEYNLFSKAKEQGIPPAPFYALPRTLLSFKNC